MEKLSAWTILLGLLAPPGAAMNEDASATCTATNARLNLTRDLKSGVDFVPIVEDDSLGFHVAYSIKSDNTFTVGIFLLPLENNEILVFGAGYADNSFEGAATEAEKVDQAIRGCMDGSPEVTVLRFVAPHGHLDHINPSFFEQMSSRGYTFAEITYHADDRFWVEPMDWSPQQRQLFHELEGTLCGSKLASFESPLGEIWFTPRPGHTGGSVDLVLDIQNDPTNRLLIRGSVAGGQCLPVPGIDFSLDAHGTVFLPHDREPVRARVEIINDNGANRLCLITDSAPRLGERWQAMVDVSTHPQPNGILLIAHEGGLMGGISTQYGRWFLDPGSAQLMFLAQPVGTPTFSIDVPASTTFLGFEAYFQALVVGTPHELCNALHIQIGI